MNTSAIPQVAITTDHLSRIIKRDMAIVRLFRQLHNDTITTDEMAGLIASEMKMNASSVKTLICNFRREGIPLPALARKQRNAWVKMPTADRVALLSAAWNENGASCKAPNAE